MRSLVAKPGRFFRRSLAATATILLLSCSGAPAPQTSGAAPPSPSASSPSVRVSITPQESWRDDAVLYFVITDRFVTGVVAINRGSAPATVGFDVPAEWGATPVRDVWTGEAVAANGGKIMAPVAPKGFRIFAVK